MALILNIDTALETASVCLSRDEEVLSMLQNNDQKDHAAWMHVAIESLLKESSCLVSDLNAVAVSIGPGSYTGLRVGLAAAKGICYALNIPLISVGTLEATAFAVKKETTELICPLIDARRMEVYTAIYDKELHEIEKPQAMVITDDSFAGRLQQQNILFCGSGSKKLQSILSHTNASFSSTNMNAAHVAALASKKHLVQSFSDLAYTEPLYIKEFYTPERKFSV